MRHAWCAALPAGHTPHRPPPGAAQAFERCLPPKLGPRVTVRQTIFEASSIALLHRALTFCSPRHPFPVPSEPAARHLMYRRASRAKKKPWVPRPHQ
jgi:hypothetical protein